MVVKPAEPEARRRPPWRITRPAWIFWLMFGVNLINYLDRLIAVAVGPTLKTQFNLTDRDIGLLGGAFLLVYTISALPLGALADRARSKARVVAIGSGLWSVFSGLTAFATGFTSLFVTRALVGVGEASYSPAGTALLSASFPREARARVMSRWQSGQLVGVLAAFLLAGALFALLPSEFAWRVAFLVSAVPGLALAAAMWFVSDPPALPLPAETAEGRATPVALATPPSLVQQVIAALRIPTVWIVIVLQALMFIAITPAITFLPIYLRSHNGPFHLGMTHTSFLTGLIIVAGGLSGVLLGGPLADWLGRWSGGARILAVGVGLLVALPCYTVMLLTSNLIVFVVAGILAVLALNLPVGPLTAAQQDVAPPAIRATVVAVILTISHLLGDIWSQVAVGAVASALHERAGIALLIFGGPALALGAIIAFAGARVYARNVRERGEGD